MYLFRLEAIGKRGKSFGSALVISDTDENAIAMCYKFASSSYKIVVVKKIALSDFTRTKIIHNDLLPF